MVRNKKAKFPLVHAAEPSMAKKRQNKSKKKTRKSGNTDCSQLVLNENAAQLGNNSSELVPWSPASRASLRLYRLVCFHRIRSDGSVDCSPDFCLLVPPTRTIPERSHQLVSPEYPNASRNNNNNAVLIVVVLLLAFMKTRKSGNTDCSILWTDSLVPNENADQLGSNTRELGPWSPSARASLRLCKHVCFHRIRSDGSVDCSQNFVYWCRPREPDPRVPANWNIRML
ncbi:hypothetical protein MAR_029547, partial [Mya arenaria]